MTSTRMKSRQKLSIMSRLDRSLLKVFWRNGLVSNTYAEMKFIKKPITPIVQFEIPPTQKAKSLMIFDEVLLNSGHVNFSSCDDSMLTLMLLFSFISIADFLWLFYWLSKSLFCYRICSYFTYVTNEFEGNEVTNEGMCTYF